MAISTEFLVSIGIQVFSAGLFMGGLVVSIKSLKEQIAQNKTDINASLAEHKQDIKETLDDYKKDNKEQINRLEVKQDKHNNLITRMVKVESSCKSAHHRLDDYINEKKT